MSKCPFCDARVSRSGTPTRWTCGTVGPYMEDGEETYSTGVICDRDCFRKALLELGQRHAALVEAARGCIANEKAGINVVGSGSWTLLCKLVDDDEQELTPKDS